MTVSFYVESDDLYLIEKYLEDYNEEEDDVPVYYTNTPTSPTQVLATLDFFEFNELVDLELLHTL
jgi:hypothetical protein